MRNSWPLLGSILFLAISSQTALAQPKPKPAECRWADETIKIDGKADEASWQSAPVIDDFDLPWLQDKSRAARTKTAARLLWDREYLYFYANMEDSDLFANTKEHDGQLWDGDVFEIFLKPADDKPGYYEFQVNPAGAVLDMFLPRRGSGGYARYRDDGPFHLDVKVALDGSLNKWSDNDRGWAVEGRIPWGDLLRSGGRPEVGEIWKFALCRYDYSVDFEGPELSTSAPLASKTSPDFHHWEDYAPLRFVGPHPETAARPLGIARRVALTTSRVIGSPEPPPPYQAVRAYPALKVPYPIFAITEPGSRRLMFIDQVKPYAKTRLCRTKDDPETGDYDVLLELDDNAYSLAFHPQFAENGFLFISSNGPIQNDGKLKQTRVTRYQMQRKEPYRIVPESAREILNWPADGHNGGALTFGDDGMLYITSGDGTTDSDMQLMGQRLDNLLSKVLRIDVDHPADGKLYSVPDDNPFVGKKDVRPETWAYGLRNPWRMTTDPRTGDIWVGNNGQDLWEQVYLIERGANYGWSVYEGSHPFYLNRKLGPTPLVKPAAEHHHSESRSLTGGVVYYGEKMPELRGMYIYGDYSTGKIWAIRRAGKRITKPREVADTDLKITCFALAADGELLVLDHTADGGFYRLQPHEQPAANAGFPRKLSDSGLFADVAAHRAQPALIPYSVNSPLWSDGAYKERFIALPGEDPKIDFHPTRSWSFPDETVLVKSFAVETIAGDPASRKWIETRFFTKQQGEWAGYSYAWNDEQTDAVLVDKSGDDRELTIRTADGERQQSWHFPSRTECMVCHSRAANFVLGVSTAQLNRDHDYGDVTDNQLRTLEALGVLNIDVRGDAVDHFAEQLVNRGMSSEQADADVKQLRATRDQRAAPATTRLLVRPPADYDRLADPYDPHAKLADRARSYLHVNCASCHISAGGGNAQIELSYHRELEKTGTVDVMPLHYKFEIADPKIIAAGDPARSVLLHRMNLRGAGQMPPLATSQVDTRATQLLREWIATLELPTTDEEAE